MRRIRDDDECDCPCHEPESHDKHGFPCCAECPVCHKHISTGLRDHVKACLEKQDARIGL